MFNKSQVIKETARKSGFKQAEVKSILETFENVIFEQCESDAVRVIDGITLTTIVVPERSRRNPRTGEELLVPEHKALKVKVGAPIKKFFK